MCVLLILKQNRTMAEIISCVNPIILTPLIPKLGESLVCCTLLSRAIYLELWLLLKHINYSFPLPVLKCLYRHVCLYEVVIYVLVYVFYFAIVQICVR